MLNELYMDNCESYLIQRQGLLMVETFTVMCWSIITFIHIGIFPFTLPNCHTSVICLQVPLTMGKHLVQAVLFVYALQCLTGKLDNNNSSNHVLQSSPTRKCCHKRYRFVITDLIRSYYIESTSQQS